MDSGKLKEITNILKQIEENKKNLQNFLSDIELLSRNDILKYIYGDIVNNNEILKSLNQEQKISCLEKGAEKITSEEGYVDRVTDAILNNETKKVLFLREFLDRFQDITDNDKTVLLNTLESTKLGELKDKMLSLINIFKIKY